MESTMSDKLRKGKMELSLGEKERKLDGSWNQQ